MILFVLENFMFRDWNVVFAKPRRAVVGWLLDKWDVVSNNGWLFGPGAVPVIAESLLLFMEVI